MVDETDTSWAKEAILAQREKDRPLKEWVEGRMQTLMEDMTNFYRARLAEQEEEKTE